MDGLRLWQELPLLEASGGEVMKKIDAPKARSFAWKDGDKHLVSWACASDDQLEEHVAGNCFRKHLRIAAVRIIREADYQRLVKGQK
jgi:hypothetical protein